MDLFNLFHVNSRQRHDCTWDDSKDKENQKNDTDFFYPNACQICGSVERLLRCSKCQMISYCGKEHQIEHWTSHKDFCKALTESNKKGEFLKGAKGRKQEAWINAKLGLINHVTRKLGRKLTLQEQKVIKFTRSCVVCHDTDQRTLVKCPNCASVSFCQQHKELFEKVHADICPEFKLCYILDLQKLQEKYNPQPKKEYEPRKPHTDSKEEFGWKKSDRKKKCKTEKKEEKSKKEVKDYLYPDIKISVIREAPIKLIPYFENCPDSMKSFLEIFSPGDLNDNMSKKESIEIADLFIRPLSVYRALKKLDLIGKNDLTVHVIDAKVEDLDTYLFWETLLHWMPNLTSLKIVLIGQEIGKQYLNPKLCEKCVQSEKKLVFELYNLDYKKFMQEKNFSTPNLVVGFKIQPKNQADSLLSIANFVAPFAFTSDVMKVAKEDHKYMKNLFGKMVDYEVFEKNPFAGIKPHLDFETDGISYEQQFLTIYTDFGKSTKKNKKQYKVSK